MNPIDACDLHMIIPISLELDWPTKDEVVAEILMQKEHYGFTTYALACPGAGWRSLHYPPTSHFRELAELFLAVKKELAPQGITCGWWITTTVKAGRSPEFQPMIRADGNETPFSSCLLDEAFRKRFAGNAALFAEIAKPAFIVTEDDYSVNASTFSDGCYCPLHLAEFAKRTGRTFTREELTAKLAESSEEAAELRRAWRTLIRDTLVGMAEVLRAAVDEKSPEIPIGYMEAGSAVREGDCTEAVARAMAGKRHLPFSRICGAFYGGFQTNSFPARLFHPLWRIETIPKPFCFIHESDTFPHTRFFTSGAQMRALLGTVYSYGYEGSVLQTQQLLDDGNEETAYGKMFAEERRRFAEVSRLAGNCLHRGVSVPTDAGHVQGRTPDFVPCLSYFGIPYTTLPAQVAFWDAVQASYLDDAAILGQLKKGLFLDGAAAKKLCERGYGGYLGVSVGDEAITGKQIYDLGERDVIRDGFAKDSVGRNMPSAHMLANGNGKLLKLTVTDPACEIVSDAVDFRRNVLAPSMTRFVNRLGGHVVVMGMTVAGNFSQSLLNYRRQKLFDELLIWCGADFSFVRNAPKVYLIENKPASGADFAGMLTAINFCEDALPSLLLHLSADLRGRVPYCIERDGSRRKLSYRETDDGIEITEELPFLRPLYCVFA